MTTSKNVLTYAKRKDKNHISAVKVIRDAGYHVVDTSVNGSGFPDILVVSKRYPRIVVLFEIKVDDEQLRTSEAAFFLKYPGMAYVIRSSADHGEIAGQQAISILQEIENA